MEMQNGIDVPLSPNRQEVAVNDLSTCPSLTKNSVFLRTKLIELPTNTSQTAVTTPQFRTMESDIGEVLMEENINPAIQGNVEKITSNNLEVDQENVPDCSQQGHESQTFPEVDKSQIKSNTMEKILNFLMKNVATIPLNFRDTSVSSKVEENDEETHTELKRMNVELKKTLEDDHISQEIDLHNTEREEIEIRMPKLIVEIAHSEEEQMFLSRAACANDREKELQTATDISSTVSALGEEKPLQVERISSIQNRLDTNVDEIEQQLQMLEKQCGEFPIEDCEVEPEENGASSSVFTNEIIRLEQGSEDTQALVDKQAMKELELSLEKAKDTIRKLREAEVEMLEENVDIRRRNIELLNENFRLMDFMMQQAAKDQANLDAAQRKITDLQDKLESMSAFQKNMELEKIELISQRTSLLKKNQELFLKAELVDQLQKDLESLGVAAPLKTESETQRPSDENAESLEQQLQQLTSRGGRYEEATLKVPEHESMNSQMSPATLEEDCYVLVHNGEFMVLRKEGGQLLLINMVTNTPQSASVMVQPSSSLCCLRSGPVIIQGNSANFIQPSAVPTFTDAACHRRERRKQVLVPRSG